MTTLLRLLGLGVTLALGICAFAYPEDSADDNLDYTIAFPKSPVRLPTLFTDGAVLQRDKPLPVWGWGEPFMEISISIADKITTTPVGTLGVWSVELPATQAGGPYALTVGDGLTTATCEDIYFGDVWLCGGQSNMVHTLAGTVDAEKAIAAANHPRMRLFRVPRTMGYAPQNDFPSGTKWEHCTPETAASFSALGYHFGRELHQLYDVPIGIIEASWVNTPITLWTSEASNSYDAEYEFWLKTLRRTSTPPGRARLDDERRMKEWMTDLHEKAEGSTGTQPWFTPDLPLNRHWKPIEMPDIWERGGLGEFDGTVWFRRDFEVSENWEGLPARLRLNRVLDDDVTWVNGIRVGSGSDSSTTRVYTLAPGVLKPGRNNLTMRIVDTYLWGGLTRTSATLCLETTTSDGLTSIPLDGQWRMREGLDLRKAPPRPWMTTDQWPRPAGLYNAMIAPLVSYSIRGVVWSQGEADMRHSQRYRYLLQSFIRDWRARWNQPDMPFIVAQIAGLGLPGDEQAAASVAELRDSQAWVRARTANMAMVPVHDIASTTEPHYMRKHIGAERLARAARVLSYGEDHVYEGPKYKRRSQKRVKGGRLRIEFETSGTLVVPAKFDRDELPGFMVAGSNRKWHPAKARLVDDKVVEVWSDEVKWPAAVRFGWGAEVPKCLYNEAGLPAHPFRTDAWKLVTP